MSETKVSRRSRGEDAIYFAAAKNRYVGSVSLGYGPDGKRIRRKVFGKTKQEVRDRLKALHKEMDAGVKSSKTYTVREAVEDWLREGLDGTSERTRTLYEGLLGPLLDAIGARPLRVLSAGDVRSGLGQLADRYSTRSLQITRLSLERAIRHAEADDLVGRNVAALVKAPQGRTGRPSKSFTLQQAKALLAAAEGTRLHAYVVLSLLVGIRTEEARALRWDHVVTWVDDSAGWQPVTTAGFDPARVGEDRYAIYVWRSERHGGDTKTGKSWRTLALPHRCVKALRQHMEQQDWDRLLAGEFWQEHGLVFASRAGTPLAPFACRVAAEASDLASPVTSCPAERSSSTVAEPIHPEAPVTKTRMTASLRLRCGRSG
jgi:integrase